MKLTQKFYRIMLANGLLQSNFYSVSNPIRLVPNNEIRFSVKLNFITKDKRKKKQKQVWVIFGLLFNKRLAKNMI